MNAITQTKPDDFLAWCKRAMTFGHIRITGDEEDGFNLVISHDALESAYRWLADRYDAKKGSQCMDFVLDQILNMDYDPDNYAAKLIVQMVGETDQVKAAQAAQSIRHYYARRSVEYFKSDLVRMAAPTGPDPLDARKNRIESSVVPYVYPVLR